MPRKPRIQFEGAVYHIINRGNYRRDVFGVSKTAVAFEKCLFEMVERRGWLLHAYVIMRNHYHLVVETPQADLVEGMHWLQGTFATRFNRFRGEQGHLFQSRYRALLVEPGPALVKVVNYVHLNPVRAGIVPVERLQDYEKGSYQKFVRRRNRPALLVCDAWLRELSLRDSREGWSSYAMYLAWFVRGPGREKSPDFEKLSKGWAIGSPIWRQTLARKYCDRLGAHRLRGKEVIELKEARWLERLEGLLAERKRTLAQAVAAKKGAAWKIELAHQLRRSTTATNAWIARTLHMGTASSVGVYLCAQRKFKK